MISGRVACCDAEPISSKSSGTRPRVAKNPSCRGLPSGEPRQRLASEPRDPPVREHARAERLVEADRRLVPVEHRPLKAPAAPVARDDGELREKLAPEAAAAVCGAYEDILEPQARSAEEGRVSMKKQGETCNNLRFIVKTTDQ